MKILLIHPQNYLHSYRTGIYRRVASYSPITMPLLAALVPKEINADIRIVNEMIEDTDPETEADLVGITAIAGTSSKAYQLADTFRSRGIPVVMGGLHATMMKEEALEHADSVVCGYAEKTWPQLLGDFCAGKMKRVYRENSDYSFKELPCPRRELSRKSVYMVADTLELTRGCPRSCEFCVLRGFTGCRYYKKPIYEAIDEVKSLKSKMILFLDANLVGDKEYAAEFFTRMEPLKKWWAGCATSDIAEDKGLLRILVRSGCKGLLMGFETLCQDTLDCAGKGFNDAAKYKKTVKVLHDHGIAVHACFVFGFDSDTRETFEKTYEFVKSSDIDFIQYTLYTPFPGTPLFRKMEKEGRILTRNWALFNGQNCVFAPRTMSSGDLETNLRKIQKYTYGLGSTMARIRRCPPLLKPLFAAMNLNYGLYTKKIPGVRFAAGGLH
ncbi:MAG: radical SAM protein [Candidatus Omnitrophota bacterium]